MPSDDDSSSTSGDESPDPGDGDHSQSGGGPPSGPDGGGRPPANVALRAVPYAVPFTAGIAFLVWGVPELDRVVSTYYGNLPHLFGALVILTVGSVLLLYGSAGALAAVMRARARA